MNTAEHPDRKRVLAELHARPFIAAATPQRLLHFAFQVSASEAERDCERFEQLADDSSKPAGWLREKRHLALGDGQFRWERHGEFISYTAVVAADAPRTWPAFLVAPGLLLVAVDLRLASEDAVPTAMVDAMLVDGRARVISDFAPDSEGFVTITVTNHGMSDDNAGATIQRVLELETYRCFALLGLPVAERAAHTMAQIEDALPTLMEKMNAASSLTDNRALLDRLSSMSLELERSSASTHFRFGATKAYAELVRLRLEALTERTELGGPGLSAFFSRRFDPAIRTCVMASDREANLSRKLTRAAQLLRTRVDIALESQNQDLLETMGNRVRLQLRLQQTVEGLSVAAISYYVASLFHLLVSGLRPAAHAVDPELLTSLAVAPIVACVALAVRRVRRHHDDAGDDYRTSQSAQSTARQPEPVLQTHCPNHGQ